MQEAKLQKEHDIANERELIDQWKKEGERRIRKEVEGEVEERVREFRETLQKEVNERAKARNNDKILEHDKKLKAKMD
jgi:hypothetical protein